MANQCLCRFCLTKTCSSALRQDSRVTWPSKVYLWLQGDVMLRALRFMDSMIQRDTMQKAAFLNDLTNFWHKFDDRVLRLKVCLICS